MFTVKETKQHDPLHTYLRWVGTILVDYERDRSHVTHSAKLHHLFAFAWWTPYKDWNISYGDIESYLIFYIQHCNICNDFHTRRWHYRHPSGYMIQVENKYLPNLSNQWCAITGNTLQLVVFCTMNSWRHAITINLAMSGARLASSHRPMSGKCVVRWENKRNAARMTRALVAHSTSQSISSPCVPRILTERQPRPPRAHTPTRRLHRPNTHAIRSTINCHRPNTPCVMCSEIKNVCWYSF